VTAISKAPRWFCGGHHFYPAMLTAIADAKSTIELETYIFTDDRIGNQFLQALAEAAQRGVRVRVLVDAYGSLLLPDNFFAPLTACGGEVEFFNPLQFDCFGVRNHRKLLLCDGMTLFIGGANIAEEYDGDGVARGWFDTVTRIEDMELARRLLEEFDRLFSHADFGPARLRKLRAFRPLRRNGESPGLFAVNPGRRVGSFQRALQEALATSHSADLMTPYFLPRRYLRKLMRDMVKRGGRVRLILPGPCDVPLARRAGLIYYQGLLRAGVEIYEYQPQILHAKLYRVGGTVFAGSSNLDVRSLKLNYEWMAGFTDMESLKQVESIFEEALRHSRRITLGEFRRSQTLWQRWGNRWAHFLLTRIDPLVALP